MSSTINEIIRYIQMTITTLGMLLWLALLAAYISTLLDKPSRHKSRKRNNDDAR